MRFERERNPVRDLPLRFVDSFVCRMGLSQFVCTGGVGIDPEFRTETGAIMQADFPPAAQCGAPPGCDFGCFWASLQANLPARLLP